MNLGGPVFGVAVLLMLVALVVVGAVQLRRTSVGRFPWIGVAVALGLVAVVVGVTLAVGRP